jgi:hypothetical protein
MSLQGRAIMTAETNGLAAYQQPQAEPTLGAARLTALRARLADPWPAKVTALRARLADPWPVKVTTALRARLADLWPLTVIALALGLTLAWTGLLVSLLWRGIERLI